MAIPINHPIAVNTTVVVTKPICPCKGGGSELITAKVLKVINNQSGFWYFTDAGITVKADRVQEIIKQPKGQ